MKYHTMSYLAVLAGLAVSVSAQEDADDVQYRSWARPQFRHERVALLDYREQRIETAYSSQMRHYYDSVWQDRKPVAPIIIIEK
jgi:hypothetical protein